jgi:hypothetical protein
MSKIFQLCGKPYTNFQLGEQLQEINSKGFYKSWFDYFTVVFR